MLRIVRSTSIADLEPAARSATLRPAFRRDTPRSSRTLVVAFAASVQGMDESSRGALRLTAVPDLSAHDLYLVLDEDPARWWRAFVSQDLEAVRALFSRAFVVRGAVRISTFGAEIHVEEAARFNAWSSALDTHASHAVTDPWRELDGLALLRAAFPCGLVHPRWRSALLDGRAFVDFADEHDDQSDADVQGRAVWIDRDERGTMSLRLAISVDHDSATAVVAGAHW